MAAGQITQGRRIYANPDLSWKKLQPGDYVHDAKSGHWFAVCPGDERLLGDLSLHTVVEHEDGTITVSPSILCGPMEWGSEKTVLQWHGFLEHGVWSEI